MPDINSDLFKQLAGIAFAPVSQGVSRTSDFDIAKQILLNSSVDSSRVWKFNNAPLPTDKNTKKGGPSTFSRVIDVIQRPEYALTNFLKDIGHETQVGKEKGFLAMDPLGPVKAGWKGLSGQEKTLPSKVIDEAGLMPSNGIGKFAVGLTADIIGDPLTYVGPGLVKGAFKGVKELTSADKTAAVIAKSLEDAPAVSTALDQTVKTTGIAEHALSPMQAALVTDDAIKDGKAVLKAGEASPAAVTTFSKTMRDVLYQNRGTPQNVILKNSDAIKMRMLPKGAKNAKGRFVKNPWLVSRAVPTAIDHSEAAANIRNHMKINSFNGRDAWRYDQISHDIKRFVGGASIDETMKAITARLAPFKDVKPETLDYIKSQLVLTKRSKPVSTLMNPIIPGKTATEVSNALVNASDAQHAAQAAQAAITKDNILDHITSYMHTVGVDSAEQVSLAIAKDVKDLAKGRDIADIIPAVVLTLSRGGVRTDQIQQVTKLLKTAAKAPTVKNRYQIAQAVSSTLKETPTAKSPTVINQQLVKLERGQSLKDTMTNLGITTSTDASTRQAVKDLLHGVKVHTVVPSVSAAVEASNSFPKVVEATTRALNGSLDEPIRVLKPGETVSRKGVTDGIMARVATWWGNKDVRPMVLDAKTSALAAAGARMDALNNLFKPFNDEQILQAWDVATKIRPRDITNPDVVKLADQLTGSMENWFKSSAIPEKMANGNSVAMRAGFTLDEMNAALKRYNIDFKFTDAANASVKGGTRTRDFSNGVDWLDSWEGHIPGTAQELKKAIFGIQTAAEQLTKEYGFLDDAASRFGSKTPKKGWVAIKNDRLDGWYFPPDMADQMSIAIKNYHDMYIPSSDIGKFIASGVSTWKSGVTKYNPRHHIANITGDSFLAWMAGVNDPRVFRKAFQVMKSQHGMYKDLEGVEALVKPGAIADAMTKAGKTVVKNKSGLAFTADQIYIAAHNYGLLQKVSAIEDLMPNNVFSKFKPFGGKLSQGASAVSESREHYVKLAHFIDVVGKSKGKNVNDIFENAAHTVRKWHPDGLDLTKEEQALRTFGIPFYSWLRKSTPLLIEGAVMNPKKAFAIPQHAQYNTQMALGINPSSASDPFPADQMFPKWIQESGIGPMGLTGATGLSGFIGGLGRQGVDKETGKPIGGYTIAGPSLPTNDLFEAFGGFSPEGIVRGLAGSSNPFFRVPAEVAFQQRVFSGVPIKDKSDYATEQIPGAAQFSRMTNMTPFGAAERAENEGNFNKEGVLNWLLNAGIVGTGPYIQSAEFEDIPRQAEQNKKYREFAKQIGSPLNSKGKIPQWVKDLYAQQEGNK